MKSNVCHYHLHQGDLDGRKTKPEKSILPPFWMSGPVKNRYIFYTTTIYTSNLNANEFFFLGCDDVKAAEE